MRTHKLKHSSSIAVTVCLLAASWGHGLAQQPVPGAPPRAATEASGQPSTSTGSEIQTLLRALAAAAPQVMHLGTMGRTAAGADVPLVVVGTDLADTSAATIKASGKTRVWIQTGGQQSGGDDTAAMLNMFRDIVGGKRALWMSSMVLLVSPVAEADGRHGSAPARFDGLPIDPASDHVAVDAPDVAMFVKMLADYDPHVSIELRSERGPCTAYAVTYAAPLHPNISEHLLGTLRDDWFPFVTKTLKSKHALDASYRGVVEDGDDGCGTPAAPVPVVAATAPAAGRRGGVAPAAAGRGRAAGRGGARGASTPAPAPEPPAPSAERPAWATSGHQAGVRVNYVALRNRFALIGVTDARETRADRVKAASAFLEEALSFVWAAGSRLKKAVADADAQPLVGRPLATSARPTTSGLIEILMNPSRRLVSDTTPGLASGVHPIEMRDRLRFEPATDEVVAAEYFLPDALAPALDLLKRHGIQLRRLEKPTRGVEQFVVTPGTPSAPRTRLSGAWQRAADIDVPAGTWVVRMNQPLARLAFILLEPASDEGLAVRLALGDGTTYPILRRR